MKQYLDLLQTIMDRGVERPDRTGTGTRGIFGYQMRFDLKEGFPLLTTKKLNTKAIIHELLWMLRGETNIKSLNEVGVHIWDAWADACGELGPVYGRQWRSWDKTGYSPVDQISEVIKSLCENPFSRRHVVSAWNVGEINRMALPPCHCLFQFYVSTDMKLSCQLYQRSCDVVLGVPFNIASYALLTMMIARVCKLDLGEFIHVLGDAHIYLNHFDAVREQLTRFPRKLPQMGIRHEGVESIFDFKYGDFTLFGYDPHPAIKAEISV